MCLYLQCAVLLYVHVLTSAVCIAALCSCADLFTYQNKIFLYVASFFSGVNPDYPIPESTDKVEIAIPRKGILYEYTYNFKFKGICRYWPDVLKNVHPVETANIQHMLIPTVETLRSVSGIYLDCIMNGCQLQECTDCIKNRCQCPEFIDCIMNRCQCQEYIDCIMNRCQKKNLLTALWTGVNVRNVLTALWTDITIQLFTKTSKFHWIYKGS